jgi:hypothetical protein
MPMYSISGRSSIAGTNVRGMFSLYAPAGVDLIVREVGIFNTTSTAFAAALARFTATGTQGSGLTESKWDPGSAAAAGTGFAGHTADATVGDTIRQASIGAAIGSGVIWTFGARGLRIAAGTSNGIGIIIPTGTGQICDYYLDWEE